MKFVLILVAATLHSVDAYGQDSNIEKLSQNELMERCVVIETLAEAMMTARQAGTKMSEVRQIYSRVNSIPEGIPIYDLIMIEAYERPRELTEERQKRAIENFRDEQMLSCLKAMRDPD